MKIFFQGALPGAWASGWQRCQTLREIGCSVVPFCHEPFLHRAAPTRWQRLTGRARFNEQAVEAFNRRWLERLLECRPDVAWLEWPKLLTRETLVQARDRLRQCRFVAFYDDNPFGRRRAESWQWELFFAAIPEFDVHLVKRTSDLTELRRRGARRAELFMHGHYEPLFHPCTSQRLLHPVSFIGTALDHRVSFVRRLLGQERLPLKVFGNRWQYTAAWFLHRRCFFPAVMAEDYADVIRSSSISLGFVSSSNRDDYTMRTFEIPACRGFLLAERTATHQLLFKEGVEAEFFNSVEECADKARHYLRHASSRERVAAAGYRRCVDDDYTLGRRMREALQRVLGQRWNATRPMERDSEAYSRPVVS
jgi:spore maturation protein CgeB